MPNAYRITEDIHQRLGLVEMIATFTDPSGRPNKKAPGRYQTHDATPRPTTVGEAQKAGWSAAQIRQTLLGSHPGKLLPRGNGKK